MKTIFVNEELKSARRRINSNLQVTMVLLAKTERKSVDSINRENTKQVYYEKNETESGEVKS